MAKRLLKPSFSLGGIALGLLLAIAAGCRSTPEMGLGDSVPADLAPSVPGDSVPADAAQAPTASDTPGIEGGTPTPSPTATAPAVAPPPPLPEECNNPQTQVDMNRCAAAEYAQADAKLNQVYQAVKSPLSAAKAEQLVSAELAWITFRDTNCDFVQAQFAGGSIQPLVYSGCMTTTTRDRTDILQGFTPTAPDYATADADLNATYQALKSSLSVADQSLLTTAQLAWITYRDRHCAYATGDTNTCLAILTFLRTEDLQNQLESRSL
ncbi:lysozyme inhibitor LprI family protein [Leptolyngbya sp. PCC 6406]|uniref:lysozyme inhibitor LprI family protein n=1 Tax=Leptolyngbya sp. PCC 6406 TaxID=1173264 RepID=UPI0002AC9B59|nr:lysozyme inhibitor LprI family protein [Leptolyngbya sp. PCC 6406]